MPGLDVLVGDAAPSATSLFPINYSPRKCLQSRSCSRCEGGTGQGAAALHPAGLRLTSFSSFLFFPFTSLNWRLDNPCARTEGFDLDEGRNVEYEPEMTSQAGAKELTDKKKKKNDLSVSVLDLVSVVIHHITPGLLKPLPSTLIPSQFVHLRRSAVPPPPPSIPQTQQTCALNPSLKR